MRVVYAVTNASVNSSRGFPVMVHGGSHWPADDPIVQENPGLFSPDPRYGLSYSVEPVVEQATANPGEKRHVRRLP